MTTKQYDADAYTKKFTANVLSCQLMQPEIFAVILDQTAFFPEAGGQSADTGTIDDLIVVDVQIDSSGVITHYCKLKNAATSGSTSESDEPISIHDLLEPGETLSTQNLPETREATPVLPLQEGQSVSCEIHWERRYSMMQHHTGEHLFSGLVHRDFGYANVGFHLSDHICTMDYNGTLTPEDVRRLESECNRLICQNLPVTCCFPDEETLQTLDYRCKGELTPPIRIVTIQSVDCCACCAPHVKYTGEIGLLKVIERKSYKGGVRLTILCGQKAFADYCRRFDIVNAVSQLFSSHYETLEARVLQLMEERSTLIQQLGEVQQQHLASLIRQAPAPAMETPAIFFVENVDTKSLRQCVNTLMERGDGLCAVFCGNDTEGYRFIAGSNSLAMKSLAEHLRQQYGAKCGGSDQMIQGQIASTQKEIQKSLEDYINGAGNP